MSGPSLGRVGYFREYVPGSPRQYIQTTGQVVGIPNATGGMHAMRYSRAGTRGLGDIFGPNQTNWITGVQNEYVVAGGVLLLVLAMMR